MQIALIAAALAFMVLHGINTGAALLALGGSVRPLGVWTGALILTLGVFGAPFLLGTGVATTLASEIVGFASIRDAQMTVLVAVLVTIVVVSALTFLRIPTSMTLALVTALTGYAVGVDGRVHWATMGKVLAMLALAPAVAGLIAWLLTPLQRFVPRLQYPLLVGSLHVAAFSLLCFAYGGNDAQKMLAVWFIALGGPAGSAVPADVWQLALCAVVFGAGSLLGMRRMAKTMATGVIAARHHDIALTEVATAGTLTLSTLFGSPAGMAQALSGALVGVGLSKGMGRIRWRQVSKIAMVWVVTVPIAFLLAMAIGKVIQA